MDEPAIDPEREQERLDELGQRIDQTRAQIDEDDPAAEDEPTFAESGQLSERGDEDKQDDQTIAPPG